VSTRSPLVNVEEDTYGTEACPRHSWTGSDEPDPLPTSCNPLRYPPIWTTPLSDVDGAMHHYSHGLEGAASYDTGFGAVDVWRRYPARGCTADPPLQGLDLVAPGYGGKIYAECGSRFVQSTGAALRVGSSVPEASRDTLDDLTRFSVDPGSERLDISLPHRELFQPSGPDDETSVRSYTLLADGAPVSIRAGGGLAQLVDGQFHRRNPVEADVYGDCGELHLDVQPGYGANAVGSFPHFDVNVGWGGGNVELFPGTVLHGTSRLKVGGAGRLALPTSVAARVDFPEGWTVICFEVDNPACGTWGPGSLYSQPEAGPVIELSGPRGYVVLMADPWPANVRCPSRSEVDYWPDGPFWYLYSIAQGLRDPGCYEERGQYTGPLPDAKAEVAPGASVVPAHAVGASCQRTSAPAGHRQPVDRGPWPGPAPWGGPRQ